MGDTLVDGDGTATIANPLGPGELRLVVAPLGYDGGTVIAASRQPDFPTQIDRLILTVACNQAAIVVQQRRSGQRLRRSELELADFFENATIGLHWVGPDGTILRANRAELELLGYAADEYVGRHIADFHVDRDVIDDILRRLWTGERVRDYEARMRCKDGSIRHVRIDSSVLWEDGRFIHTRCCTRDVTERKRAEEVRLRLAAIVASSGDAIVSEDLNGIITSWNQGAQALFGYAAEEIIGRSVTELLTADRMNDFAAIRSQLRQGEPIHNYETACVRSDRQLIDVSLTASPIFDDAGRIEGISTIARDITQRTRAQQALKHQTQRLTLLWEAASVLLVASEPEAMLHELLAKIGGHLGVDAYFNHVVAETGDALRLSSYQGVPAAALADIERLDFGQNICGSVALRRQPMVVNDIQRSDEPMSQAVKSLGIRGVYVQSVNRRGSTARHAVIRQPQQRQLRKRRRGVYRDDLPLRHGGIRATAFVERVEGKRSTQR
jgi:PAS domain S-box-containing protein